MAFNGPYRLVIISTTGSGALRAASFGVGSLRGSRLIDAV